MDSPATRKNRPPVECYVLQWSAPYDFSTSEEVEWSGYTYPARFHVTLLMTDQLSDSSSEPKSERDLRTEDTWQIGRAHV